MSDTHLLTTSHAIRGTKHAWWYEEPAGLCVVQQYLDSYDRYVGTTSVLIPWHAIRGALKRKDQP